MSDLLGWWGPNTRLGKLYPSSAFPTHAAVNMVPYMYAVSVGEDPYDGMVDEDDLIKKAKPPYQYERDKALERFRLRLVVRLFQHTNSDSSWSDRFDLDS